VAWIGGVAGGTGAVAAGTQNHSRKTKWIYALTFVVAIISFVIVLSLNA